MALPPAKVLWLWAIVECATKVLSRADAAATTVGVGARATAALTLEPCVRGGSEAAARRALGDIGRVSTHGPANWSPSSIAVVANVTPTMNEVSKAPINKLVITGIVGQQQSTCAKCWEWRCTGLERAGARAALYSVREATARLHELTIPPNGVLSVGGVAHKHTPPDGNRMGLHRLLHRRILSADAAGGCVLSARCAGR